MGACAAVLVFLVAVAQVRAACVDTVTTDKGAVLGQCFDTYRVFKGIPFAASTAGANRFNAPQPRAAWAPATWNGTVYGAGCYQTHHNPDVPPIQSEDCLNLNVWTPASAVAGSKLPVAIWIHGGTFNEGAGNLPFYEANNLVTRSPVIYVTINYRLGSLGWLVTTHLNGNYGLMDQRAAMQWVQRNIAAFGGDPTQVTIQGESAGAMSVGVHMVSPASKGLFARALMESNVAGYHYRTLAEARAYGYDFVKLLNCTQSDVACLRNAPMSAILRATNEAAQNVWEFIRANPGHILDGFVQWSPTLAPGDEFPMEPISAMAAGKFADVPLYLGTNTNEGETFIIGSWKGPLLPIEYEIAINGIYLGDGGKVLKQYPSNCPKHDCTIQLATVMTDYWFRCASRHMAQLVLKNQPQVWMYRYNHLLSFNPWGKYLPMCSEYVCHASEIAPLFGNSFNWTFTPVEVQMSKNMDSFWTGFIASGDPNYYNQVPVHFPQYTVASDTNIVINDTLTVEKAPAVCDFWDKIGYYH